jgi:hypothetical protein
MVKIILNEKPLSLADKYELWVGIVPTHILDHD